MSTARLSHERTRPRGRLSNELTGLGTLTRFNLRRDRVRIPIWIAVLLLFGVLGSWSLPDFYETAADRQARAELMANPAATALSGPGHGLDEYTFGAMIANELLGYLAIFIGIMSVLMVVRHTRANEETGRTELVRANVVGRHAPLGAALLLAAGTNLAIGALTTVGLAAPGIESVDWVGSIAFGASLAATGMAFAAITAIAAQVSDNGRGANAMGLGAVGIAYALRGAGDMTGSALSWLSPIGWAQGMRAYVDERWWPLALALVVAAALAGLALALSERRDFGSGLRAAGSGPAGASAGLLRPLGFAVRLQRGSLVGWPVSLFLFGLLYGSLIGEIEQFVEENPSIRDLLEQVEGASLIDSWLGLVISLMAMVCGVYTIIATSRPRTEESAGRVEIIMSTALPRSRWLLSYLAVALGGSVLVLLAGGIGMGLSAGISSSDAGMVSDNALAALSYTPVLWALSGLTIALYGLAPRATPAAWLVVGYGLTVGMLGELFNLPEWMLELSPFGHVAMMPAEDFDAVPLVIYTLVAAALIVVGVAGFRRRDIEGA